ncbi:MAG: hypothetical protein ACYDCS_00870 [Candidatus Dormibacteria bacterium]
MIHRLAPQLFCDALMRSRLRRSDVGTRSARARAGYGSTVCSTVVAGPGVADDDQPQM